MKIFNFFSNNKKHKKSDVQQSDLTTNLNKTVSRIEPISYDAQMKIFKSLGYELESDVTQKMIFYHVFEMSWEDNPEKYIQDNPFSILYPIFGWRDPQIKNYNFSNKCIKFDLEFFDQTTQYQWFMERMGAITNGEIQFTNIKIDTDSENWEWISFNVNGFPKRWKLEKNGSIADHFVQRFSYLTKELSTNGKYTYYSDDGQQWVIDFATEREQRIFNKTTNLNREWLGDGNHFSHPGEH